MGREKNRTFSFFVQKFSILQKKKLFLEARVWFFNSFRAFMLQFIMFLRVHLDTQLLGVTILKCKSESGLTKTFRP